jgi:hypothetical protein
MSQRLLRSQIPLRGLDGRVAQQQLNLFQLSARLAAKLRASPAVVFPKLVECFYSFKSI